MLYTRAMLQDINYKSKQSKPFSLKQVLMHTFKQLKTQDHQTNVLQFMLIQLEFFKLLYPFRK